MHATTNPAGPFEKRTATAHGDGRAVPRQRRHGSHRGKRGRSASGLRYHSGSMIRRSSNRADPALRPESSAPSPSIPDSLGRPSTRQAATPSKERTPMDARRAGPIRAAPAGGSPTWCTAFDEFRVTPVSSAAANPLVEPFGNHRSPKVDPPTQLLALKTVSPGLTTRRGSAVHRRGTKASVCFLPRRQRWRSAPSEGGDHEHRRGRPSPFRSEDRGWG